MVCQVFFLLAVLVAAVSAQAGHGHHGEDYHVSRVFQYIYA
jgi:hypothetical protein